MTWALKQLGDCEHRACLASREVGREANEMTYRAACDLRLAVFGGVDGALQNPINHEINEATS